VSIFFIYFRNWSVIFHERLRTLASRPPPPTHTVARLPSIAPGAFPRSLARSGETQRAPSTPPPRTCRATSCELSDGLPLSCPPHEPMTHLLCALGAQHPGLEPNGIKNAEFFVDHGLSGTKSSRPVLDRVQDDGRWPQG